eukprot:CAMPEP_0184503574 /NCGR_PEP_ID=MMETSP0113_2-20130426/51974_1 /TAXON_ID=91329 /ORGANISM="Norrisiella sphaerica, Strain BC52" /LENGTH=405 /DNA_ID=CAMNT_0026893099 /DNA_START=114 /DNA_END=1331 /DNA_ORIENTATION=+
MADAPSGSLIEEKKSDAKKRGLEYGSEEHQEKKQKTQVCGTAEGSDSAALAAPEVAAPISLPAAQSQQVPPPLQSQNYPAESTEETIEIRVLMNAKWMGGIIGKGGSVIGEYRQRSGSFINVSNSKPGCNERIATMKGTPQNAMLALRMVVHNLVTQMITSATYYPQNQEKDEKTGPFVTLLIPNGAIGSVMGKGGSVIKQIREMSSASIKISDDVLPGSTDKSVTVRGTMEQIWAAVERLCTNVTAANGWGVKNQPYVPNPDPQGFMAQFPGAPFNPNEPASQVVLPVPTFLIGSIIGKGGKNIKEIRQRSGAMVKIADAKAGAHERLVTITGTQAQHQVALSLIYAKMNQSTGQQITGYMPQNAPGPAVAGAPSPGVPDQRVPQMPAMYGYGQQPPNPYSGYY